jgi:glycosyltransferase involved in cell wall biosynthesis
MSQHSGRASVFLASDFAAPTSGNFLTSILALADRLDALGVSVLLGFPPRATTRDWFASLPRDRFTVVVLPGKGERWKQITDITKLIREHNIRIIHTHFTIYDISSAIASQWCRWTGHRCQTIWHAHSPHHPKSRLRRALIRNIRFRLVGRTVEHVVVSEGGLQTMRELGMPRVRSRAIFNGIDFDRATRQSTTREAMRRELGVHPEQHLLLAFGYDPYVKGSDIAVDAAERLVRAGRNVVLCLVGQERTQEWATKRVGTVRPPWLIVRSPRECVADYYAACDVYLLPSRTEGLPFAVCEAMANHVPVIASDIRGLEWAHTAPGIRFVPPENAPRLARLIEAVLDQPEPGREMESSAAARFVRERFTIENWIDQLIDLYRDLGLPIAADER